MNLAVRMRVRHKRDRDLGIGEICYIDFSAGVHRVYVRWPPKPISLDGHTPDELEPVLPIVERLQSADLGSAACTPFVLRLLGRWFEARHSLTGELSNQPFQMLPHQVVVANRIINSGPESRRWLIADDVGLGKTIEAGMVMEVLRKRSLGRFRCLIVTPAGLRSQWRDEMERRFGRRFREFDAKYVNDLESSDLLIASVDTLKSKSFEPALQRATPWDLVIFDEAHHLATDTAVQRYGLARHIRQHDLARNLLFLTATPHSGNAEHFWNMLRLLREDLFPNLKDVTLGDGRLNKVMLRNRKSEVTDAKGNRIFKGIQPALIHECEPKDDEVAFYEALLEFVRKGYGVADRLKARGNVRGEANAVGFLMSTFRKLASSSRAAIQAALENRLRCLESPDEGASVASQDSDDRFAGEYEEKAVPRVAIGVGAGKKQKQRASSPIENEVGNIKGLLKLLGDLKTPDTKMTFFIELLQQLPSAEKALIFTEYRGTQAALVGRMREVFGDDAVIEIHGSMDLGERRTNVDDFNEKFPDPRFLVSTEAGGEGLNMQKLCHVVINYDLPWNPIRLQQRIGRVYRYGQHRPVQVHNVRLKASKSEAFADARIDDYLRRKIREIADRLAEVQGGAREDLEGEVLGHVAEKISVDSVYQQAVTEGVDAALRAIDEGTRHLEQILSDPEGMLGLFKGLKGFDISDYQKAAARVQPEQLEFFVRSYLQSQSIDVEEDGDGLLSFRIPERLSEVARRSPNEDPYSAREELKDGKLNRVTFDKERAQRILGCRLLRFGDVAFDSMVRHVQDSDFSVGVASVLVPGADIGWLPGEHGCCAVFELKILRQEGSTGGARLLRDELVPYAARTTEAPSRLDAFFNVAHRFRAGSTAVNLDEVRRAYADARILAERQLTEMRADTVNAYGTTEAIVPQLDDFALAWLEAT